MLVAQARLDLVVVSALLLSFGDNILLNVIISIGVFAKVIVVGSELGAEVLAILFAARTGNSLVLSALGSLNFNLEAILLIVVKLIELLHGVGVLVSLIRTLSALSRLSRTFYIVKVIEVVIRIVIELWCVLFLPKAWQVTKGCHIVLSWLLARVRFVIWCTLPLLITLLRLLRLRVPRILAAVLSIGTSLDTGRGRSLVNKVTIAIVI